MRKRIDNSSYLGYCSGQTRMVENLPSTLVDTFCLTPSSASTHWSCSCKVLLKGYAHMSFGNEAAEESRFHWPVKKERC
jgi:hypothetical protein